MSAIGIIRVWSVMGLLHIRFELTGALGAAIGERLPQVEYLGFDGVPDSDGVMRAGKPERPASIMP
jgi:hypothetical protein